jgi:TP901 family phage tail tape measure protein
MLELAKAIVTLNLDTGPFDKALARVEQSVGNLGLRFGGMAALGAMGVKLGVRTITEMGRAMGDTIKLAGDLQQTYTTLSRVTGLNADETKRLADNLKDLSTTKAGITLEEINKVAEFAGRMGVGGNTAEGKIEGITKVAADLADLKLVLSDMDIEDAATRMIRILNVFGRGVEDVNRFGSALVAVDNASTATGQELLEMVNRMQGMGSTLGATIPQLIALAGVMRDAGVEVDSGSTAIGQLGFRLSTMPQKFAQAVRMSAFEARQLAHDITNNPVRAIGEWMAALKRMDSASQMKALSSLHMTGRMSGQILLQLAQKMGDVNSMLEKSNNEWRTQKSLQEGVEKSSQTVWAQMSKLGNEMKVAAANVGEYTLPIFSQLVGLFGDVMRASTELLSVAAPDFKALSDSIVSSLSGVREWFGKLKDRIDEVQMTYKILRATWPLIMEEVSLKITKAIQTIGYGFAWVGEAGAALGEWFGSNWRTIYVDAFQVAWNFVKSLANAFMTLGDVIGQLGAEIGKFLADPLNHEWNFDVSAKFGKAFEDIRGKFSRETLAKNTMTPALVLPGWHPEQITGKLDELIKAVREQRDKAMQQVANALVNEPKKDRANFQMPAVNGALMVEQWQKRNRRGMLGGEADKDVGKSFDLVEFRNHLQQSLTKSGTESVPQQQLTLAQQRAKIEDDNSAQQAKRDKDLQAKIDATNKALGSILGAVKNPVFQA